MACTSISLYIYLHKTLDTQFKYQVHHVNLTKIKLRYTLYWVVSSYPLDNKSSHRSAVSFVVLNVSTYILELCFIGRISDVSIPKNH